MRNKFTELINQGVASFNYTNISREVPEQDIICRTYNNIWSIPSDTHMSMLPDGRRVITGHMVGIMEKWDNFVCAGYWGAVVFRTTGYWSLCNFLQANGLCGKYDKLNGEVVYIVEPCENSEIGCPNCPPSCCVTTESKIPMQISVLTKDNNPLRIKECYKNKESIYDIAEALNESIYVKGNEWTVNGDKLMCPIGNKIIVL